MKYSIVRLLAVGLFLGALFSSTISMASAEISPRDICAKYARCHVKIPIIERTKYINNFMQVKST